MTAPAGSPVTGERREQLRADLQALGFDEVRFARATAAPESGLGDWLAAGRHADMAWMERTQAIAEHSGQEG